jgi:hypothetical protein
MANVLQVYKEVEIVNEYRRCEAGRPLGIVTISDTHASADFIAFLKKLDAAYPVHQKIRLVLDNHSAHTGVWDVFALSGTHSIL